MVEPGRELASIDFDSLLGGPLVAVVNAQAQSALATVNFIKEVGFKKPDTTFDPTSDSETRDPIYVKFKYWKETQPFQPANPGDPAATPPIPATPAVPAQYELHYLEVPILTMLPIPYLRMEETTVEFNAKINSIESQRLDSSFKIDAAAQKKSGYLTSLFSRASLKVSTSYQRTSTQGSRVERTYSMRVFIKAVQDDMPGGMERILGILEDGIAAAPTIPAETRT